LDRPIITEGGFAFPRDIKNIQDLRAYASMLSAAQRQNNRVFKALEENKNLGGREKVLVAPHTMAYGAEDFSTMPTDALLSLYETVGAKKDVVNELNKRIREATVKGEKGKFSEFVGLRDKGLREQLFTGAGLTKALGYTPRTVSTGTFTPAAASAYMSPYMTNVSDVAARELRRAGDIEKSKGAMGAIGRGTFGGARQALLQAEQERGLQQNIGDIYTKGQQAAYENAQKIYGEDTARALQAQQANQQAEQGAAQLAGQTGISGLQAGLEASHQQAVTAAAQQTSELERLKTQAASEGEKQALQQKIDDLKYQTAMEARDWEKKQLEFYNAMLRGNAGLAQTQIQYAPQASGVQQALGGGLGLLGLSKALG